MKNGIGREIPEGLVGDATGLYCGDWDSGYLGSPQCEPRSPRGHHGNKLLASIDAAIEASEIRSGMSLSFHHCYRNGDHLVEAVVAACHRRGIGDLHLCATALFPIHQPLSQYIQDGTISSISGSVNGSLGQFLSQPGQLKAPITLRSHGGRWRAVAQGEAPIDVAFIAASQADRYGNATGIPGNRPCGPIGYAKIDSMRADRVVVVTNELSSYPCWPHEVTQSGVDWVVPMPGVGDPTGIESGSLKRKPSKIGEEIAERASQVAAASGLMKEGFSFQGGAGGLSLGAVRQLAERMSERRIRASFAIGGVTETLVELLHRDAVDKLLDCQAFDRPAIDSLLQDRNHIVIDPGFYANPAAIGCATDMLDIAFLGATEVDLSFNVNVITHSDGTLRHGIGGHQDVAFGASCTIIVIPAVRKGRTTILPDVTTVATPGSCVDCIVTELGIAVNPKRKELRERLSSEGLPVRSIDEIRDLALRQAMDPPRPAFSDGVAAIVQWRDGSILDVVRPLVGKDA